MSQNEKQKLVKTLVESIYVSAMSACGEQNDKDFFARVHGVLGAHVDVVNEMSPTRDKSIGFVKAKR